MVWEQFDRVANEALSGGTTTLENAAALRCNVSDACYVCASMEVGLSTQDRGRVPLWFQSRTKHAPSRILYLRGNGKRRMFPIVGRRWLTATEATPLAANIEYGLEAAIQVSAFPFWSVTRSGESGRRRETRLETTMPLNHKSDINRSIKYKPPPGAVHPSLRRPPAPPRTLNLYMIHV
jgi:hypothetical protein